MYAWQPASDVQSCKIAYQEGHKIKHYHATNGCFQPQQNGTLLVMQLPDAMINNVNEHVQQHRRQHISGERERARARERERKCVSVYLCICVCMSVAVIVDKSIFETFKCADVTMPLQETKVNDSEIEVTVRSRVFAPHTRGLQYITVQGFVMEYAANNWCANFWFPQNWKYG